MSIQRLRNVLLVWCITAASAVFAAVPPSIYTGGEIGKQIMLGDFPSDLSQWSWWAVRIGHGDDGFGDTLSTVHYSSLTPVTAAVDYAEISIIVKGYPNGPAVPGFIVRARKAVSPTAPTTSDVPGASADWPSFYYWGGWGWTTASATLEPVLGDKGKYRVDVTKIVNELAAQVGGTGTSITFILEPTHTPNGESAVQLNFDLGPTFTVYPDLADREYQRQPIAGGKTIFYIPLDADDLGPNGFAVAAFRSVVAVPAPGSGPGTDQLSTSAEHGLWGISSATDHSLHIISGTREYGNDLARKLVAPYQLSESLFIGGDPEYPNPAAHYYWPVRTQSSNNQSEKSYLTVAQFVQAVDPNEWLWDFLNNYGFAMWLSETPSDNVFASGGFFSIPGATKVLPAPYRNIAGEIKTLCMYYDAKGDKFYMGYHNGDPGTAMVWSAAEPDAGYSLKYDVSGLRLKANNKLQGVASFEWTTTRRPAEVKAAVERARELWASGVKALPPMLY